MKRFEYISVSETQLNRNMEYHYSEIKPKNLHDYWSLNQYGEDGWELVSVTQTYEYGTTYFFKREII